MASSRTETAMAVDGWGLAGVFCCFPSPAQEPSKMQNARRAPVSARPRAIRSPFERSVPPLRKRTAPIPTDAGRGLQVLARRIERVGEAAIDFPRESPGGEIWRDAAGLNPAGPSGPCGFESRPGHCFLPRTRPCKTLTEQSGYPSQACDQA